MDQPNLKSCDPPLPSERFMELIPAAIRAACTEIGFAMPDGVYIKLDADYRCEFRDNDTVVEAVHPCPLAALDRIRGMDGHIDGEAIGNVGGVSIVATLRREFALTQGDGIRVFWRVRAVRVPVDCDPNQLSLWD